MATVGSVLRNLGIHYFDPRSNTCWFITTDTVEDKDTSLFRLAWCVTVDLDTWFIDFHRKSNREAS